MDAKKYKTKLEEEKKLIEEELSEIGKVDNNGDWEAKPEDELNSQEVLDEGDLAERSEDYEERSIKLNTLEVRLADINKALHNIENGEYGICTVCKNKIESDRLEVNPAAKTCKMCINKII